MGIKIKDKMAKTQINWFKVGIIAARIAVALVILNLGYVTFSDAGERTYNKYLHALRKMYLPSSKPGDAFIAGQTYDQFNKIIIQAVGVLQMVAGLLILLGKNVAGGIILVLT